MAEKKYKMENGARRQRLAEKAAKIPNKQALDIILNSFPENQRAGLLEQIKPLLAFPLE